MLFGYDARQDAQFFPMFYNYYKTHGGADREPPKPKTTGERAVDAVKKLDFELKEARNATDTQRLRADAAEVEVKKLRGLVDSKQDGTAYARGWNESAAAYIADKNYLQSEINELRRALDSANRWQAAKDVEVKQLREAAALAKSKLEKAGNQFVNESVSINAQLRAAWKRNAEKHQKLLAANDELNTARAELQTLKAQYDEDEQLYQRRGAEVQKLHDLRRMIGGVL